MNTVETIKLEHLSTRADAAEEGLAAKLGLDPRVSNTVIFFGTMLILVFYLLAQRYDMPFPAFFFFISIALMVISLLYQVLFADLSGGFAGIVLLEITLAALVFHLIYQIPGYGLYGSDSYLDLASLKAILESGHLGGIAEYVQITSFFPVIHIAGAEFSLVTGIDYFNTAKWFPSIIGTLTIPLIYLLVSHLFKSNKAALLAALLFATMQHYIMFGSLFVRETIAIVLALSAVYFYTAAASSRHPVAYRGLAIFFLGGTILAHHLTSVMLLVFLLFYWLFTVLSRSAAFRLRLAGDGNWEGMSLSFLIIGIVGTLAYWITTVVEPVQIGLFFLNNVLTPSEWGLRTILEQETTGVIAIPGLRYFFLIYGSYISYLVFGIILVYKSLSRRPTRLMETPIFTSYLLLCGIAGFMSFYLLPPTIGGDRFLAFGWLFAFGPLALAIVEFRNRLAFAAGSAVVLFFIFVNLYTIHPTAWNSNAEGAGAAAGKEDFALSSTVDFSRGDIIGYATNLMTIYEAQNNLGTDAFFLLAPIDFNAFEWIIVNRAAFEEEGLYSDYTLDTVNRMKALDSGSGSPYDCIYESNNLAVFKRL